MPIEIIDLDDGIGNIILGSGILTVNEYIDALKKHLTQDREKFKRYKYSLTDYTAVTGIDEATPRSVYLVVNLCKQAAQVNPDAVIAAIADKEVLFGLSRMWEILMEETGWDIMVFRTRDSAERWIREKAKLKFGIENLTIRSSRDQKAGSRER